MSGRATLGLYNCYDPRQWHDIMRITLARAGPVALAFDCDLATFGFPFAQARRRGAIRHEGGLDRPLDVAHFVSDTTTVGESTEPLVQLAEERRFHIHPFPTGATWGARHGRVVATTPHPAPGKETTPLQLAQALQKGEHALVLFGLGPRGLPEPILTGASQHLEITGRGLSMETATALAALPALLAAHRQHLEGQA